MGYDNGGTYKIVRMFFDDNRNSRTIKRGLTFDEAQAHCRNPETGSASCTSKQKLDYTKRVGKWFDGYESE